DYNREVREGLHITSMAGTWISIVEGFGGMRVKDNMLCFNPLIPTQWKSYSFKVCFRENILKVIVSKDDIAVINEEGPAIPLLVFGDKHTLAAKATLTVERKSGRG
ncbi:MAG: glycosyl hydrolase family 65 protein, partial [Tenuifilaceae bacterium]